MNTTLRTVMGCIVLGGMAMQLGCGSQQRSSFDEKAPLSEFKLAAPEAPRKLAMFDGFADRRVAWRELLTTLHNTDVAIIGADPEDDPGHQVQVALVQDLLAMGGNPILSMSVFERNEQGLVNSYLAGETSLDTLGQETHTIRRFGQASWDDTYAPILAEAKARNIPVVAANARELYVRLARRDGFAELAQAPAEDQGHFSIPTAEVQGAYRERYAQRIADSIGVSVEEMDAEYFDKLYTAELLRDSTMAASIAEARRGEYGPVIHLTEAFHADYGGGTQALVQRERGGDEVIVVSILPSGSRRIRPTDRDRGDIIIYTPAISHAQARAE